MFLAQSIINSVFIPKGVEARIPRAGLLHGMPVEYSQWAIVKLPGQKQVYVRSYNDMQWRHIDLHKVPLAHGSTPMSFMLEEKDQSFADVVKPALWGSNESLITVGNQTSSGNKVRRLEFV